MHKLRPTDAYLVYNRSRHCIDGGDGFLLDDDPVALDRKVPQQHRARMFFAPPAERQAAIARLLADGLPRVSKSLALAVEGRWMLLND